MIERLISSSRLRQVVALAMTLLLVGLLAGAPAAVNATPAPWEHLPDGEYVGTVPGMWGDITVMAVLEEGMIVAVEILDGRDDLYLYDDQYDEFVARILAEQRLDVDVITGASVDCEAILAGLYQALEEAGVQEADTE